MSLSDVALACLASLKAAGSSHLSDSIACSKDAEGLHFHPYNSSRMPVCREYTSKYIVKLGYESIEPIILLDALMDPSLCEECFNELLLEVYRFFSVNKFPEECYLTALGDIEFAADVLASCASSKVEVFSDGWLLRASALSSLAEVRELFKPAFGFSPEVSFLANDEFIGLEAGVHQALDFCRVSFSDEKDQDVLLHYIRFALFQDSAGVSKEELFSSGFHVVPNVEFHKGFLLGALPLAMPKVLGSNSVVLVPSALMRLLGSLDFTNRFVFPTLGVYDKTDSVEVLSLAFELFESSMHSNALEAARRLLSQ